MARNCGGDQVSILLDGDGANSAASREAMDHLSACRTCQIALDECRSIKRMVRGAFEAVDPLHESVRRRVLARATEVRWGARLWNRLAPMVPRPALGLAAPALVLLIAALLPVTMHRAPEPATAMGPVRIDMKAEAGAIRLAWSDGRGRAYKVYKASDPRLLGMGRGQVVHGNQWVDEQPNSSPIVFYRVE